MKYLIVGLGNIGNEYAHTRHNIGFDVAFAFVVKHGAQLKQERLAYFAEVRWKGRVFCCICPTTFMNLSGKAVKYWMDKEKIELQNVLVIVDDLALPLTKLRIRPGGSDAGHNGLKSIQEILGTTEYPKLRFGIGNNYPKGRQIEFVLGKWTSEEEATVKIKIEKSIEAIESFSTVGIGEAKAITIAAALEIGRRRQALASLEKVIINTSGDVAKYLQLLLQDHVHEVFAVLFLNRANKINHFEIVSEGGITGTVADPRIILKKALEQDAVSLVLCHNHPSGSLKPSKADEELTRKIKQAALFFDIKILDHVIVSDAGYYSFADEGIL